MTPDEVVKELEQLKGMVWDTIQKGVRTDKYLTDRYNALSFAITQIQDYQKLREKVSGIDLPVKELGKIVMFIRHSMFLPENDKLSELNKMIREAIVTYLQQPTEH
jgi:hypothetical protein